MNKNAREGLNSFGKIKYHFDYDYERKIYMYLWHEKLTEKDLNGLSHDVRFDTYSEWKTYVETKYKDMPKEDLEDFSKHLNQKIRNNHPVSKCWDICIPILISMLLSQFFNFIIGYQGLDNTIPLVQKIISIAGLVGIIIAAAVGFVYLFYKIFNPIWECEEKNNFLKDYKEIIDRMISNYGESNTIKAQNK